VPLDEDEIVVDLVELLQDALTIHRGHLVQIAVAPRLNRSKARTGDWAAVLG